MSKPKATPEHSGCQRSLLGARTRAKVFRLNTHRNLASLRRVNPRVRSLYKQCWCDACLTVQCLNARFKDRGVAEVREPPVTP
jgi:hypothetical protein